MASVPQYQPPPTWAPVISENDDPKTGKKSSTFNPVWLQWFVELTQFLGSTGINPAGAPGFLVVGPPASVRFNLAMFDNTTGNLLADSGIGPINFVDAEFFVGDGVTTIFPLSQLPVPTASMFIYKLAGNFIQGIDYTIVAQHLDFGISGPPPLGIQFRCNYRY